MNDIHLQLLATPEWRRYVEDELLPWALDGRDLGDDVLEIGPGPGHTTDVLRRHVDQLTAVELDADLAAALADRLQDTNVTVVCADATRTGLPDGRFSAATCFTMLHYMPSPEHQGRLFAELVRVLRPGGVFVGTDSIDTPGSTRLAHGRHLRPRRSRHARKSAGGRWVRENQRGAHRSSGPLRGDHTVAGAHVPGLDFGGVITRQGRR